MCARVSLYPYCCKCTLFFGMEFLRPSFLSQGAKMKSNFYRAGCQVVTTLALLPLLLPTFPRQSAETRRRARCTCCARCTCSSRCCTPQWGQCKGARHLCPRLEFSNEAWRLTVYEKRWRNLAHQALGGDLQRLFCAGPVMNVLPGSIGQALPGLQLQCNSHQQLPYSI